MTIVDFIERVRAAGVDEQWITEEIALGCPTLNYFGTLSQAELARGLHGLAETRTLVAS